MADDIGWAKILITAVVSSISTASVVEPIKRWQERKRLRRAVYQEIVYNFAALHRQVEMAEYDPRMIPGIGQRFALSYRRFAYELGPKDPAAFYALGWTELYWIELIYKDFDQVVNGRFEDETYRLSVAKFACFQILTCLKKRSLSQYLMLAVSPKVEQEYFKKELPKVHYLDSEPPNWRERILRVWDRFHYWRWRSSPSEPSVWLNVSCIVNRAAQLESSAVACGGCASRMAIELAAQSEGDLSQHAFHSAVHDYLLNSDKDDWRRWRKREWVAWPMSRLLHPLPPPSEIEN